MTHRNDPQDSTTTSYKTVLVHSALILTSERDTGPFLLERAVHLGSLIRGHLIPHRYQLRLRLQKTGSLHELATTIERIIGMPISLKITDLEQIFSGEHHA